MARPVPSVARGPSASVPGLGCYDLRVVLGDRTVLSGVSISVAPGHLTAVLGVSGSGKSTLLRAIAGFAPLAEGRVEVGATDITGEPPERRPIASLFQTARLFPALNVQSNVAFGLRVRGVGEQERLERAKHLLVRVGMIDRRLDQVATLSGGEQQRVALARALAFAPELVLLDEPFSAVDTPRRRELRNLVAELLAEHRITSLLVTHDIADAKKLADRIAILDEGRLLQEGPTGEVLSNPTTSAIADLVSGAD